MLFIAIIHKDYTNKYEDTKEGSLGVVSVKHLKFLSITIVEI